MTKLKSLLQAMKPSNETSQLKEQRDKEIQNTKFHFDEILFEITRKCNLKCAHCMRGEMQPISMKKEVIDKMFEISSGIDEVFLTGGEPFLEPDLVEYIVNKIIENDYDVTQISVITNGTILNDRGIRCAKALNKFAEWSHEKHGNEQEVYDEQEAYVSFLISNDDFHGNDAQEAYEFYRPYLGKYVAYEIKEKLVNIATAGRARENGIGTTIDDYYFIKRRVRIDPGNYIPCILYLTPTGGLTVSARNEWVIEDEKLIGNIMQESLVDMLERNQWNEFRCDEAEEINYYMLCRDHAENSKSKEMYDLVIKFYEENRKCRVFLHKLYPYLNYDEITLMAYNTMELRTRKKFLSLVLMDHYEESMSDLGTIYNVLLYLQNLNEKRKRENCLMSRQVPFDSKQEHLDQCTSNVDRMFAKNNEEPDE